MSNSFRIPVIGIVGGIGSGKSTIAREAARLKHWSVIDADKIGHSVLELPDIREKLHAEFGPDIFDQSGAVIRSALAVRVFGSPNDEEKKQLEAIVHPVIRSRIIERIRESERNGQDEVVLLDAAVLLESGWREMCSAVVYIDTSLEERLNRVRATRHWSEEQLRTREASQMSLELKKHNSDFVISNRGEPTDAVRQMIEFVESIISSNNE